MYPASTLLPALGELLSAVHSGCKDRAHLDEKAMMVLMAASKDAEKALLAQAALLRVAELEQQVATLQETLSAMHSCVPSNRDDGSLTSGAHGGWSSDVSSGGWSNVGAHSLAIEQMLDEESHHSSESYTTTGTPCCGYPTHCGGYPEMSIQWPCPDPRIAGVAPAVGSPLAVTASLD